jgi:tetratricopeptide (TPR) repeat protein
LNRGTLALDYAYLFSVGNAASLDGTGLPESHLLEAGYRWGKVLPVSPEDAGYKALMRQAAIEEGSHGWLRALWDYRRAQGKKPDDPMAREGYLRTLTAYNRERAAQYYQWGREAESRGFLLEAQRQYDWASQLDPSDHNLQEAQERLRALTPSGGPTGAMADPRVVGWLKECVALSAQGKREEARQMLQKAKILYPDDKALDDFEKAITTEPVPQTTQPGSDPESEIYLRKGRSDLARQTWQRVLVVDPSNNDAKNKLAASDPGAAPLKPVPSEDQVKARNLYEEGLIVYLRGDTRKAIEYWEKTLALDPNHENALNNLVRARLELSGYGSNSPKTGGAP